MARARRKKGLQIIEGGGRTKPLVRTTPEVCPLCQVSLPDVLLDATTHLQSHAPVSLCSRCDQKEKGWRLDWDGVKYPRQDLRLFYCSACGRYAPANVRKEVS